MIVHQHLLANLPSQAGLQLLTGLALRCGAVYTSAVNIHEDMCRSGSACAV